MGILYIVATPIGNLQDITLRAAQTILQSEVIIAESASKAGILINFLVDRFPDTHNVEKRIVSLSEDEEENKIPSIIKILEGSDAALISEAGTPLISDPGFKLVREAIKRGIKVVPIPGVSAPITALSASGLPTDKFVFLGFLPKSQAKKEKELERASGLNATIILFESPHRLSKTLEAISKVFKDKEVVIARELTKIHEEMVRGKPSQLLKNFKPKGEITILI